MNSVQSGVHPKCGFVSVGRACRGSALTFHLLFVCLFVCRGFVSYPPDTTHLAIVKQSFGNNRNKYHLLSRTRNINPTFSETNVAVAAAL